MTRRTFQRMIVHTNYIWPYNFFPLLCAVSRPKDIKKSRGSGGGLKRDGSVRGFHESLQGKERMMFFVYGNWSIFYRDYDVLLLSGRLRFTTKREKDMFCEYRTSKDSIGEGSNLRLIRGLQRDFYSCPLNDYCMTVRGKDEDRFFSTPIPIPPLP